jgi:hypothetical protein
VIAPAPTARAPSNRTPILIGAALIVAFVIVGLVAGDNRASTSGPPLSPSSTAIDGTRGLVLLLRDLGTDVQVGQRVPDAGTHVALLLHDGLDDRTRSELRDWAAAGNTLVVTDPFSPLTAPADGRAVDTASRGTCTIAALADVGTVEVGPLLTNGLEVRPGSTYDVRNSESCFGDGVHAFVVRDASGSGSIVSIGNGGVFANGALDRADNSVLAARLLAPSAGGRVAVLDPNPPGSGTTTLGDLIADRVFQALLQISVAFVVYALWRSRRVGRPVLEPQPVAIAGSQFVRAVGGLHQRSRATDRAAATLRRETRRLVSDRFGLPRGLDTSSLAQITAARTGLDRDRVAAALSDAPILDEAALVTLGHTLDTIRQEVLDGRTR